MEDKDSHSSDVGAGGSTGARYKLMSPAKLPISKSTSTTIPPGLSPTSILESPVLSNINDEKEETTLPQGFTVETITLESGRKKKVYTHGATNHKFYSKKDVARFMEFTQKNLAGASNRVEQLPKWLPDGWTMELVFNKYGKGTKVYICGEDNRRFYSKPQVLGHVKKPTKDGLLDEGKLKNPTSTPRSPDLISTPSWENVSGLDEQQKQSLGRLQTKGVLWKYPEDQDGDFVIFRLSHGGDVKGDGNCLFTALQKEACGNFISAKELRRIAVKKYLENLQSLSEIERKSVDETVKNLYSPNLKDNRGLAEFKDLKVLAKKQERQDLDLAITKLLTCGMPDRKSAAKFVYEDKCIAVKDALTWAKYMSISGSPDDEYDIINLRHNKEGLLHDVDENREGRAVAFGDDIAITALASEFNREIYVLLAIRSDPDLPVKDHVFFLPHHPKTEIRWGLPIFLLMKERGCDGGGDHFEPVVARPSSLISREEVVKEL